MSRHDGNYPSKIFLPYIIGIQRLQLSRNMSVVSSGSPPQSKSVTNSLKKKNLALTVRLLTCIREMNGSNLGRDTDCRKLFACFLSLSKNMPAQQAQCQFLKRFKGRLVGFFQHCSRKLTVLLPPNEFLHSSPEAPRTIQARETSVSEGRNCQQGIQIANPEFTKVLGSFTCRKDGTWDRFFHFRSEGRHAEDYSGTRKIQRVRTRELGYQRPAC